MSPPDPDRDARIEAATTAWRARDAQGIRSHHAWHDLDEQDRQSAFERTIQLRDMEAALDPNGLSSTARAVLARIRATRSTP